MQKPFIVCEPEKCSGCQCASSPVRPATAATTRRCRTSAWCGSSRPPLCLSLAGCVTNRPACTPAPRVHQRQRNQRRHAGGQGRVQRLRLVRGSVRVRRGDDQPRRAHRLDVQPVRRPRRPAALCGHLRYGALVPLHARPRWPSAAATRSCCPACCPRCAPRRGAGDEAHAAGQRCHRARRIHGRRDGGDRLSRHAQHRNPGALRPLSRRLRRMVAQREGGAGGGHGCGPGRRAHAW